MRVSEIRDRIVELSHHGAGVDGEMNRRAMGWLNSAYHEILDELLPHAPAALARTETVTSDTVGRAVLTQGVYRLLQVADRQNGRVLALTNAAAALAADPAGTAEGEPKMVYADGAAVVLQPKAPVQLVVRYVPQPADLQEGDAESAILLPVSQHSGLVWGGLVWCALFERGFVGAGELGLYQARWQQAKESAKLALVGVNGEGLRVQPFTMV